MGVALIVTVVVVLVPLIWWISVYNRITNLKNTTKESWSDIDVELKRRYDLIPNLVETVKGYMKHEQETLENVVKARQQAVDLQNAGNIGELMKADGALTQSLGRLFAVAEGYPDLKANQNMLNLQEELATTENRIGFSRQAYNDAVMKMNNGIEQFPSNIVAGMFNFKQGEFFEVDSPEERKNVKVSF